MYQRAKRCALSVRAAFGNITSVYGHIDENGRFVRNWPVRKMAITDKSLENAGLSVKCVLLTDKSSKMKPLSVNSSEIMDRLRLRTKMAGLLGILLEKVTFLLQMLLPSVLFVELLLG
ncbi:hypothetical protein [Ligilactobacillus ruminis]|uniref:hypothetical protein n=1 Tax=Ligilactobacillus ruminis TaxID=1623 RepID=UPI001786EBB0|nr:hypothetical protein [Ligilactobacillus ruminis]